MPEITIHLIPSDKLSTILPLAKALNPSLEDWVLASRLNEMRAQNYQCVGAYAGDRLVAICGLWITTRFYCGKQVEVDNVIVDADYRSQGIGHKLMEWATDYARSLGCETCELNCYVSSARSHKFYFDEGFAILGFHFQKRYADEGH